MMFAGCHDEADLPSIAEETEQRLAQELREFVPDFVLESARCW